MGVPLRRYAWPTVSRRTTYSAPFRSTEHDDDLNLLHMLQQSKCCASPAPSGNARIKMALRYSFGSFWLAIVAVVIASHGSFFRRFTASFM
jgi:hypothetical protein